MPSATVDKKQGTFVIPAQHTDRLRNIMMGVEPCPVSRDLIVQQIFSADYSEILNVPLCNIVRLPMAEQKAARLVQCANFRMNEPHSCKMGDRCKFVHANLAGSASRHSVHINYAWPSIEAVTYERFAAGSTIKVAAPSSKTITDVMESHLVLKTKALTGTRRPLSHCAHYYFNRTCNLGSECQFIHAIFIDPNAKPYQRAPAPTQLGRPRRGRGEVSHEDELPLPTNEVSPSMQRKGTRPEAMSCSHQQRSPGADSSVSDYCAPGDHTGAMLDPLTAVMLTPQTTPATTPTTTPRHGSRTPQAGDLFGSFGNASFPGQPSGATLHREGSGRITPGYRHTPYGNNSRQNSLAFAL